MDEETINPQPPTGTKRDQDSDTPSPDAKTKNFPQPKRVKTGGNGVKEIEIDGHQDQEQEQRSNHKDNDIDKRDADPDSDADADAEKDSLFGSDISASQECYICLEIFHKRRGEARVVQPCGHLLDAECWVHWFGFLQRDLKVEIRCPVCRGLAKEVDDWGV
ncbi:hypothetical protein F5882DRAFT_503411 [Hyaloscypha sp. PMI_1271]|nr:hypothetical protein F5882DRAFT_503411 [Hyaloscypha sp. PMI_1271]